MYARKSFRVRVCFSLTSSSSIKLTLCNLLFLYSTRLQARYLHYSLFLNRTLNNPDEGMLTEKSHDCHYACDRLRRDEQNLRRPFGP